MQTHMPPGSASRAKGPLVFLDYDKDEIDAAYTQSLWAPNQTEVAKRNAQKSAAALARLGAPRRLAYGPTEIEKVDVYATKRPNAPINVFFHVECAAASR
jgi:arylformamidase